MTNVPGCMTTVSVVRTHFFKGPPHGVVAKVFLETALFGGSKQRTLGNATGRAIPEGTGQVPKNTLNFTQPQALGVINLLFTHK